jgi:serine/threonine-protein phosphatase 6 regulatory ankyrin repeat subunit B
MHFDAISERSENHLAENEQSMHHVSNSLLLGSDIRNESDLCVQWLDAAANGNIAEIKRLILLGADVGWEDSEKMKALHFSAESGHKEIAEHLLNHGAAVDARNDYSTTALHLAAENGNKEVVALLLDCGAEVDARNHDFATALHLAAEKGHTGIIQLLLNSSASVDTKDENLNTSLHKAAKGGHKDVIALLLLYGATTDLINNNSETALHLAVTSSHEQVVKLLLDHGASADLKDNSSNTPLHSAVRNGDHYITSQLLTSGANTDGKSTDGKTLLAEVSKNGDTEMATLLLNHGASLEAINLDGQTSLIIAVVAAEESMVSLLIEKGSHMNACDNDLLTALHWSAKDGHMSILELLLQKMANTESKSKDGNTALHIAIQFNRANIVAALIDYKANINAENGNGKSPIEVAISKGHIEIVFQLKDAGARMGDNGDKTLWLLYLAAEAGQISLIKSTLDKVDEKEKKNYMNATLHEASRHGQVDVVTYLLDNGAEIESLNDDGLTPLFLAGQYPNVISTLVHRGACINARSHNPPHQGILHNYASLDQIEGVLLLLNCGYNIYTRDNYDETALHYVAKYGKRCEIADILLLQGVDVNAKGRDGWTALHYCSKHQSLDLAILLIKYGIDIDAMSFEHRSTALHLAIKYRNLKLISLLVRHRADVNARDDRETVLHMAVRENLKEECALLIESGANVNSRDKEGDSPLANALINHNPCLVKLLLEHGASVDAFRRSKYVAANIILYLLGRGEDYNLFRRCLDVVNLFVKAGADCSGMSGTMAEMEKIYPTMRKLLREPSYQQLKLKDNMSPSSFVVHDIENDIPGMNDCYSEDESESENGDEACIPLKELTSNNINVYEGKISLFINMHRFSDPSILIIFMDCVQSGFT